MRKDIIYLVLTGLFFIVYSRIYFRIYGFITGVSSNVLDIIFIFSHILIILPLSLLSSRYIYNMIKKEK